MKWLKRLGIGFAVLLAAALVLPLFISLDDYIPRIEQEASAKLKQPVSIKSIRLRALPLPHVTIDGITVGAGNDVSLGEVRLTPDLWSLLQTTKVIKSIEIDSARLTDKAMGMISAWRQSEAAKPPDEPPLIRIGSIVFRKATVIVGTTRLGPFDAHVILDANGEPSESLLTTQDGKLKVVVKPGAANYLLEANAQDWTVPVGPALVFDKLAITGTATADGLNLGQVTGRLYGGTVAGKATLSWQKGFDLSGNMDLDQVETRQIAALLSTKTQVSGKLSAKPVFSASAASADRLRNALRLETEFRVDNGVIHGVDIMKAATSLTKQGASGGETRFDQLSGHLVMEGGDFRFTGLEIASGAMAVDGSVNISAKEELSGRINAKVKAMGTSAHVPLNVAGTLDAPLLYPTAGTVAGAAVGTAILGPGFGTSVGAKVGGWAEDLFGASDEAQKRKK